MKDHLLWNRKMVKLFFFPNLSILWSFEHVFFTYILNSYLSLSLKLSAQNLCHDINNIKRVTVLLYIFYNLTWTKTWLYNFFSMWGLVYCYAHDKWSRNYLPFLTILIINGISAVFCILLFVFLSLFLLTFVLSVLFQFTDSNFHFNIFQLFLQQCTNQMTPRSTYNNTAPAYYNYNGITLIKNS